MEFIIDSQDNIKDIHTSLSTFLSNVSLNLRRYLIAFSTLVTLSNFTDLQMETTLVENAVEKFNL